MQSQQLLGAVFARNKLGAMLCYVLYDYFPPSPFTML
jgi:hypothetical protein